MDVPLDDLIAQERQQKKQEVRKDSAKRVGGPRARGAAILSAGAERRNKSAGVAGRSRTASAQKKRQSLPATPSSSRKTEAVPKIGTPIMLSRRLLLSANRQSENSTSTKMSNRRVRSPVVIRNQQRQYEARLSELDRQQASKIEIITQLDRVPTPTLPLAKFVDEHMSTRSSGSARRLADRFR